MGHFGIPGRAGVNGGVQPVGRSTRRQRDGIVFCSKSRSGLALDRIVRLWTANATQADAATRCKK
ncbi:hypothetical protein GLA29479_1784 [Lysobacter antibioticus]|nr:hypothetical protein GLA29479_1784 [Lysobacter antibioticus]